MRRKVIITAPSLDPTQNVSGVSSVVQFIIENNPSCEYQHFQLGKKDKEKRGIGNVTRVLKCYKDWKKIIKENSNNDEAIVHYSFPLNTPSILRDPAFMYYALKNNVKMVIHIHGGLFLTSPKIPFFLNRILRWVFSWDVPFIVLSELEKELLQKRFGAKNVAVLPNCPEEPRFVDSEDNVQVESGVLKLGYLGRIESKKGMTELLEACVRLKSDGFPFKLMFAGKEKNEGEYLPLYNKKLNESDSKKCFEYVGLVSGEKKREFLRSLDVLVMPTYFEGLPMSLLECMSYGVVPVITNVGSVSTVVKSHDVAVGNEVGISNGENGVFIKVKDVDSIVESVKYLNEHRRVLKQLGENAKAFIAEKFSAKGYVEKLNRIYSSL